MLCRLGGGGSIKKTILVQYKMCDMSLEFIVVDKDICCVTVLLKYH